MYEIISYSMLINRRRSEQTTPRFNFVKNVMPYSSDKCEKRMRILIKLMRSEYNITHSLSGKLI